METELIADPNRIPALIALVAAFALVAFVVAGKKAISALVGLVVTVLILMLLVVPWIVGGGNPVLVGIVGSILIAVFSIYIAHGFNRKTTISIMSTVISLLIGFVLATLAIHFTQLFGLGSEEASFLAIGPMEHINLRGLLLAAIVIGTLGVLDDVTTTQTAAIYEFKKSEPSLAMKELYKKGMVVGREHITSLINTLFLAYVGASFPLIFLLTDGTFTIWESINTEFMAEEIVRALVGSMALIIAVPISTFLAAYFFTKRWND